MSIALSYHFLVASKTLAYGLYWLRNYLNLLECAYSNHTFLRYQSASCLPLSASMEISTNTMRAHPAHVWIRKLSVGSNR